MKVASKLIFLLQDADGLVASIAEALQSSPKSSLRTLYNTIPRSISVVNRFNPSL